MLSLILSIVRVNFGTECHGAHFSPRGSETRNGWGVNEPGQTVVGETWSEHPVGAMFLWLARQMVRPQNNNWLHQGASIRPWMMSICPFAKPKIWHKNPSGLWSSENVIQYLLYINSKLFASININRKGVELKSIYTLHHWKPALEIQAGNGFQANTGW